MANCSDNYWNALILPRILQTGAKHNKETTAKLETPGQNSFFKSMKERPSWNFWSCSQEKSNVVCWKMPYLVRSFFPSRNICEAAGIFRPSPLTTLEGKSSFSHHCWLVVWNMNFIVPYIGKNHPNWLSYFSEGPGPGGLETTNQIIYIPFPIPIESPLYPIIPSYTTIFGGYSLTINGGEQHNGFLSFTCCLNLLLMTGRLVIYP